MDFNEIEKAYAMGRAYAQGLKYAKLMAKLNTVAQDTMKDGFATLVDSEGHPYVANLNPKEKERYSETKKPLSQVKKEKAEEGKKEPEAKKTEEKKKPESEKKGGAEVIELHPEKENGKKLNFADKVKKIVSQEFRYAPGISAMGEFDAKYLEKQLNKLDPNEEGAEEALEDRLFMCKMQ